MGGDLGQVSPHARSLWMFLNAQDRFHHAEEVRFTEDRRRCRMWAGCVITRARIAVKLARRPGADRRRTLILTITWPHCCDLEDRTATVQLIGEKYLRRWGILVDDLQLFED